MNKLFEPSQQKEMMALRDSLNASIDENSDTLSDSEEEEKKKKDIFE